MPIRLSVAVASGSIEALLPALKAAGFEGVDVPLADAVRLAPAIHAAGLHVACVTTAVALHAKDSHAWSAVETEIASAIETAVKLKAAVVRVYGGQLARGESINGCLSHLNTRLKATLDAATDAGVILAVQNAGSFVLVKDMWQLLEALSSPLVGACLDVGASSVAGESPVLTVPTLNVRIAHVRVWDQKEGKPVSLGEGDAKVKLALERLRGIGYTGYVSWAPPAAIDEPTLKAGAELLKLWAGLIKPEPPAAPAPAAKPAAAKPAATAATAEKLAAKPAEAAPAAKPAEAP